jgi:hypothetical protein
LPQLVANSASQSDFGSEPTLAATQLVPAVFTTWQDPHEETAEQTAAPLCVPRQKPLVHSDPEVQAWPFESFVGSGVGVGVDVGSGVGSGAGAGVGVVGVGVVGVGVVVPSSRRQSGPE